MIIEETLNNDITLNENNIINPHINHKKPKLVKILIAFLAIAFVTTLLVGIFKLYLSSKEVKIIDTKSSSELRKLYSPLYKEGISEVVSYSLFGKKIDINFIYGCKGEFAYAKLLIKTDEYEHEIGAYKNIFNNNQIKTNITRDLDLMTFQLEKIPGVDMKLTFKVEYVIVTYFNEDINKVQVSLYCDLSVDDVKVIDIDGFDKVKSITVSASGTFLKGNFVGNLGPNQQSAQINILEYANNIKVHADGINLDNEKFKYVIEPKIDINF